MNNFDNAVNIMKKYNLWDKADIECKKEKICQSPYDIIGRNDIYCKVIDKEITELNIKLNDLKLKEIDIKKQIDNHTRSIQELRTAKELIEECSIEDHYKA